MDKYYWYTAHRDEKPKCDWLYIKRMDNYGFNKQPNYEVIEKYDLRNEFYGTLEELKQKRDH